MILLQLMRKKSANKFTSPVDLMKQRDERDPKKDPVPKLFIWLGFFFEDVYDSDVYHSDAFFFVYD